MNNLKCTNCDSSIPVNSKFCLNCGKSITLACKNCKNPLPNTAKFCNECGCDVQAPIVTNLQTDQKVILNDTEILNEVVNTCTIIISTQLVACIF